MLETLRQIVLEVSETTDLHQALDIILRRVRQALGVDVCSVYLSDYDLRRHVLMATSGLNPSAVGTVSLEFEQGVVGMVATRGEPVNLDDAPSHPAYKYIPGSGEEPYHAFLGVPVIHQRKVLGVLVVQQREERRFSDDDVSFMLTLAAQIAGAISHAEASGRLANQSGPAGGGERAFDGLPGAPGVGVGQALVVFPAADLRAVPDKLAVDVGDELAAFERALGEVRAEIEHARAELLQGAPEADALFEAYRLLLSGEGIELDTVARIRAGSWAPGALRAVIEEHAKVFSNMEDAYLRERAEDIRDLGARVLLRLRADERGAPDYPAATVLVGAELSAADILQVPRERLVGIISGRGSANSHVAILARALGVPAVMGVDGLSAGKLEGKELIVDGYRGRLYVDPGVALKREYLRLEREEQELVADLQGLRDQPPVTRDGRHVGLYVNTALISDVEPALRSGTEGVGLYRSEIPFLVRDGFPSEDEQFKNYRQILKAFHPRPVVMRTLDIGGDKPLPYFNWEEDNPFLGWRGVRVALDHPELFRVQLRAMLRADVGLGNMRLLFPMVSGRAELAEVVQLIDATTEELIASGLEVRRPPLGAMIEVPSAIYEIKGMAELVDFFSVGTNDLTQYLLAVDRNNPRVAKLFDPLHPAVLHALQQITTSAHAVGRPVTVCGEMAGEPAAALLLLGMGLDGFSMNVASLPRIKWLVRSFAYSEAVEILNQALGCGSSATVLDIAHEAIEAHGLGGLIRAGR